MASEQKHVLVTGGAGYIGSHVVLELLNSGKYQPVVVDNLINSSAVSLERVQKLTGKTVDFYNVDMLEISKLRDVFTKYKFFAVIHFAGLKAVGESVQKPLMYYRVNIDIAINLMEVMREFGVKNFIFSSSATVYGDPQQLPIDETHAVGKCTNPYGKTKLFVEEILKDVQAADKEWNVILLRYFNPIGAHESGEIGEDPNGVPNNLMPFLTQVVIGIRPELSVFGDDYETKDGTGVRDYIHVVDLAQGHVTALAQFESNCGLKIYNLGRGSGVSVLELVHAMEKASGRKIPYKIVGRRTGDLPVLYADVSLAEKELNWKAMRSIDQACEDSWRWQNKNPNGFKQTTQ